MSQQVAKILHEWLPSVLQMVKPYMSSEDIDKGSRWSIELARELESSSYGIICVTPDNISAPWLNFEAGALSKAFDASRVSPFLYKVRTSELTGPLTQFQATSCERDDVSRLVGGLNELCGEDALDTYRLQKVFEVWWPDLDERLSTLTPLQGEEPSDEPERGAADVLEEVLELVRGQQRLLSTPETLLPEDYLKSILLKGAGSYKPRPSSFAFYPSYKEFNRVLAARVSFATSEIVAVSGGHYPRGSLTDPDVLSQWAGSHSNRRARRLVSAFLDSYYWPSLRREGLGDPQGYSLRVISDDLARSIGECAYILMDGERAAVSVPLFNGGGFTTDDQETIDFFQKLFETMWASSMEFKHFVAANEELFRDYPEEEEFDDAPDES